MNSQLKEFVLCFISLGGNLTHVFVKSACDRPLYNMLQLVVSVALWVTVYYILALDAEGRVETGYVC